VLGQQKGENNMMGPLKPVAKIEDIPRKYQDTPISFLLAYHNLGRPLEAYQQAALLIGMCMDNRKRLRLPANFAFILRSGGANLRYSEFKVSFAIAVGGVKALALIGHNHCGMVNLAAKREQFVQGLVDNAGWDRESAEENFQQNAPSFEIGNEIKFVQSEVQRLRQRFPKILVAPLMYRVEDNLLYFISED
jgi:carbonic anhydrase